MPSSVRALRPVTMRRTQVNKMHDKTDGPGRRAHYDERTIEIVTFPTRGQVQRVGPRGAACATGRSVDHLRPRSHAADYGLSPWIGMAIN